jgi:non-canonical purine NTP pyrophosphatase, rdgB/HAM1 family
MQSLILATGNPHKVEEFTLLLADLPYTVASARSCGGMPEVEESGRTFAANAALKAFALRERAPADAWVLADDSGVEVDGLGGAPGVYSARYAGAGASDAANVDKLLTALEGLPESARRARFRCVLCLLGPDREAIYFEGSCEGRIAHRPTGEAGFGYDPVFIPEGYETSFAQLGESVKARLSHRAKAVEALRAGLR